MTDSKVKVYILEIGHVEKTSLHGSDTSVTQHDAVMKSDYDALSSANTLLRQQLEKCKQQRNYEIQEALGRNEPEYIAKLDAEIKSLEK